MIEVLQADEFAKRLKRLKDEDEESNEMGCIRVP